MLFHSLDALVPDEVLHAELLTFFSETFGVCFVKIRRECHGAIPVAFVTFVVGFAPATLSP